MPSIRFTVLVGNHDIYYHNRLDINSIEIIREFPNVNVITTVKEEKIDGYKIIHFPWLVDGTEPDTMFKEILKSENRYDLCLGHFEINGFETSPGIVHEGGMENGKFKNFQRVISGHFHLRRTSGHISYLGCPYPITWADYGDLKGIHVYDLETKEFEFIENKDSPVFIRVDIEDLLQKKMDKIKQVKGNFVRMVINGKYSDQVIVKAISKIESFLPLRLDVENNFIEEFDGEVSGDTDVSKLNDPGTFLMEYIKNLEIPDTKIDKKELLDHVSTVYASLIKEKN
jgi:DNA repair exonuclease SbcCD nuclease subunit